MSTQLIDRKAGTVGGRILKQLIYGQNKIPATQVKIGGIREAPNGPPPIRRKESAEFKQKELLTTEERNK